MAKAGEWEGWIKAVLMQEADLPTVRECCRLAAILGPPLDSYFAAAREAGARAMQQTADYAIQRAFTDESGDDAQVMRVFRKVLAVVRALDAADVAKEAG